MTRDTDEKIMAAFNQLVITHGYRGTTTKLIAQKAGINESTIFRHFKTKEAILNYQLKLTLDSIEELITSFIFTDNLEQDIIQMGRAYLHYINYHQAIFLTGLRDSYQYPQIQRAIQQLTERMIQLLTARFAKIYGADKQSKRNLQTLFLVLFGRVTMELTYPQSRVINSDQEFINTDFRYLVHCCCAQYFQHDR